MGRICEQGRMAQEAGLAVFLGMYLDDLGGDRPVGVPDWASEPLIDIGIDEAWRRFWVRYWDSYQNAWRRLARTCAQQFSPAGIQLFSEARVPDSLQDAGAVRQAVSALSEEVVTMFEGAAVLVPGQLGEDMTPETLYEEWKPNYIHAPFEFIRPVENTLRRPRIRIALPVAATQDFEASLRARNT